MPARQAHAHQADQLGGIDPDVRFGLEHAGRAAAGAGGESVALDKDDRTEAGAQARGRRRAADDAAADDQNVRLAIDLVGHTRLEKHVLSVRRLIEPERAADSHVRCTG